MIIAHILAADGDKFPMVFQSWPDVWTWMEMNRGKYIGVYATEAFIGGWNMTTMELINDLQDWDKVSGPGGQANLLINAADQLEALEERVCIMRDSMGPIEKRLTRAERQVFALAIICGVMACVIAIMALW